MEDLVSAIITTYKRPISVLNRAICSVLNQTHKNLEIIVVNDYPNDVDNSNAIKSLIESYEDNRVHYCSYETNKGACYARNFGAKVSNGEYIAFLDDDDVWLPEKTEKQLKGFENNKIGLVYSPFYEYDQFNDGRVVFNCNKSGMLLHEVLMKNTFGGCSMVMIRKEVFFAVGGFDVEMKASQDYDLWVRIAEKYQIKFVGEALCARYMSDDSLSLNFNNKKAGWDRFLDKFIDIYMQHIDCYNFRLNMIAVRSIRFEEYKYAFSKWVKAIQVKPISKHNLYTPAKGLYYLIKEKRSIISK